LNVSRYAKFIVAIGAAVAALVTAASDGVVDGSEAIAAGIVFLGAIGVYRVPNSG
jgi:hypothetical protein